MKPGFAKKTNIGILTGFLISFLYIGLFIMNPKLALSYVGTAVGILGNIAFVWGCCMYASGKGYHAAWGVLGLANMFGLVVLVFFPDRHAQPGAWKSWIVATVAIVTIFFVIPIMVVITTLIVAMVRNKPPVISTEVNRPVGSLEKQLDSSINYLLSQAAAIAKDPSKSIYDRRAAVEVLAGSEDSGPIVDEAIINLEAREPATTEDVEILALLRNLKKNPKPSRSRRMDDSISYFDKKIVESKINATTAQLGALQSALDIYQGDNGKYPSTEQGIKALYEKPKIPPLPRNWHQCLPGPMKDSWEQDFVYVQPGTHNTATFDIYSKGPNGVGDGSDPDDINNWK